MVILWDLGIWVLGHWSLSGELVIQQLLVIQQSQTFRRPPHLQSRLDAEPPKRTVLDPDGHSSPYRNRPRIDENLIAGAGFDVFANEPLTSDYPLLGRDNVILTPHLAWWTKEAFERVERDTLDGIRDILAGNRPKNLKNIEVLER